MTTDTAAPVVLELGDCIDVMAAMPAASVDAIVCDPPYGLEFMGKDWDRFRSDDRDVPGYNGRATGAAGEAVTDGIDGDHPGRRNRAVAYGAGQRAMTSRCEGCGKRDQFRKPHACPDGTNWRTELVDPYAAPPSMLAFQNWTREWGLQALRILKPGGHLLAFGGTRTYHRLAAGLEDAGLEIRDCIMWLYGSGFPKSHDVVKAIEKSGAAAELAEPWAGWGTALKPALEPVVVARRPLAATVAATVLEHGTGALNVGGCVIPAAGGSPSVARRESHAKRLASGEDAHPRPQGVTFAAGDDASVASDFYLRDRPGEQLGRWPANVVLDEAAAEQLDAHIGDLGVSAGTRQSVTGYGMSLPADGQQVGYGDDGGPSRFFYCAKTSQAEREAGLAAFDQVDGVNGNKWTDRDYRVDAGERPATSNGPRRNVHPTVKPVALMRWLVRLVTPPGGLVLDPFLGSGTTGIAADLEGFRFVGIEREPDYLRIAEARMTFWRDHGEDALAIVADREEAEQRRQAIADSGQLDLLADA